jgi:hypothetical protein
MTLANASFTCGSMTFGLWKVPSIDKRIFHLSTQHSFHITYQDTWGKHLPHVEAPSICGRWSYQLPNVDLSFEEMLSNTKN